MFILLKANTNKLNIVLKNYKQQWIEKGYEHFAIYGPENLSINKLSKELGSLRASFYHHFGDIEIFIQSLLDMHWQIIIEYCSIGKKECKKLFPDLYVLIAQFPLSMKFISSDLYSKIKRE